MPVSDHFLARIEATGASVIPLAPPAVHPLDDARPRRGLVAGWTPGFLERIERQTVPYRWSPAWAENMATQLRGEPSDIVVADFVLIGALAAAEAARVPAAALMHVTYPFPAPGLPPLGYGFLPARNAVGAVRDGLTKMAMRHILRRDALPFHNRARQRLGLPPLRSPLAQYDRAARVLVLASAAFDFPARRLPSNVRYVGTPIDDVGGTWDDAWLHAEDRPLVLVSLSTLPQGQTELLRSILIALENLPVRALVTHGPALAETVFNPPPNARLEVFVPHSAVLPRMAALVTQCGLGTVTKALTHAVPMVCIPLAGDQADNASRVVARGAGVRLDAATSPLEIRQALQRVLHEPRFRERAARLGAAIARQDAAETAALEIESLAGP